MNAHCWAGEEEEYEREHGYDEAWKWRITLDRATGICMLPDGHDGPHEWTDSGNIYIRFADEPTKGAKHGR